MSDDVYLAATNMPSRPSIHADADCPRLQGPHRAVARDAVDGFYEECSFCHDDIELGGGTVSDAYRTLERAGPDDLPLGGDA